MNNSFVSVMWGKPRAKPWDIVKGRRFACCHSPIGKGHWWLCLEWGRYPKIRKGQTVYIPRFAPVSVVDIG